MFVVMIFKIYFREMTNERNTIESSRICFFLPGATDRKELINQYMEKVSLSPVICLYEQFQEFSPAK